MRITSSYLSSVNEIKLLTSTTTQGIGLLTFIVLGFCNLFGVECNMYNNKIEAAKNASATKIIEKAKQLDATGIMNIRFQITGLTVFMSGIAYK